MICKSWKRKHPRRKKTSTQRGKIKKDEKVCDDEGEKMVGEVRKQQPLNFVDKKSEIKSINEVVKVKNKSHFEGEEEAWLRR
jgi:hypothetical protein